MFNYIKWINISRMPDVYTGTSVKWDGRAVFELFVWHVVFVRELTDQLYLTELSQFQKTNTEEWTEHSWAGNSQLQKFQK